ncbi:MAG: hypothetical protein OES13_06055 [Acidimicrobiia bacterium]|nr:hypothetical protein [Acidimicrobiia bacterium]
MTDPEGFCFDVTMRVVVAVSPPLLAELLTRLFDSAGVEVADTRGTPVDVALILDGDTEALDAEATITLDTQAQRGVVADRTGQTREVSVSGPRDIVGLVRQLGRR